MSLTILYTKNEYSQKKKTDKNELNYIKHFCEILLKILRLRTP